METAPRGASAARGSTATAEGYLALALIALSFLAPSVDHPADEMVVVGAIVTGIAFGLALDGVRFGLGGGRLAAEVALGLLSLRLLVVLAAGFVRWEQILGFWRR